MRTRGSGWRECGLVLLMAGWSVLASAAARDDAGVKVSCGDPHAKEIVQVYVRNRAASATDADIARLKTLACKVTRSAMQDDDGIGKRRLLNQMPFYLVERTAGGGKQEDVALLVSDLGGAARHIDVALAALVSLTDDELHFVLAHEMAHAIERHGLWQWLQKWLEILLPCALLGTLAATIGWRVGRIRRVMVALVSGALGIALGALLAQPVGERTCLRADAARMREREADTVGLRLMTQAGMDVGSARAAAASALKKIGETEGQASCVMGEAVLHPALVARLTFGLPANAP